MSKNLIKRVKPKKVVRYKKNVSRKSNPKKKKTFEVIVVATMSAGKSTVINALIGQELLHSANEATTATITRIHDNDNATTFYGNAYSYTQALIANSLNIDSHTLQQWNADPNIKTINVVGNIQALHNATHDIVIYDTPGPNNSQDKNHESLTMEVINDGNYGLILYVLNATQLGIDDDQELLAKVLHTLKNNSHKNIIFLLNKADTLDEEKGEDIVNVVENAKTYLKKIGFHRPTIIPTVASYALLARKLMNNEPLTRTQRRQLINALELSNESIFRSSTLPTTSKQKIYEKYTTFIDGQSIPIYQITDTIKTNSLELNRLILRSGFASVSYILQNKLH